MKTYKYKEYYIVECTHEQILLTKLLYGSGIINDLFEKNSKCNEIKKYRAASLFKRQRQHDYFLSNHRTIWHLFWCFYNRQVSFFIFSGQNHALTNLSSHFTWFQICDNHNFFANQCFGIWVKFCNS